MVAYSIYQFIISDFRLPCDKWFIFNLKDGSRFFISISFDFYEIEGKEYKCVCIDNIHINSNKHRGKSLGTSLINAIHSLHNKDATVISNIVNKKFGKHLITAGWIKLSEYIHSEEESDVGYSVYKIKV